MVNRALLACLLAVAASVAWVPLARSGKPGRELPSAGHDRWSAYGGGNRQIRYSRLAQINRRNLHRLQVAWTYDTGDAFPGSEMQCNPLVVGERLYAASPRGRVFALDAATGREIWSFRPSIPGGTPRDRVRIRGLMYWSRDGQARIYVSYRHRFYALDAATGSPCLDFGDRGAIDLRRHLGRPHDSITVSLTTPGVVYRDLLIIGSTVGESLPSAPGDIRAYDARSGKLRWKFRTIPRPGEPGHRTWPGQAWKTAGGANSWAGMSLDEQRGLVYVPTGSAAFDFFGGNRSGHNLFANSLLCLKAETGERVWHFQVVRHDVWDRDLPAPPSLVTVVREGRPVDAVAQITKSGHVFTFDRETGRPLFPLREFKVPIAGVPGERLAATQVLPSKPPPFARQHLTEDLLTDRTPEARREVLKRFRKLRNGPQFTPPSLEGTVLFPGFDGGGQWGGAAFDPESGRLYVNSSEMAWILRLVEREAGTGPFTARQLYRWNCSGCHRQDRSGAPPEFPSLVDLEKRRSHKMVRRTLRQGGGRMPGFAHLGEDALEAILGFVLYGKDASVPADRAGRPLYRLPYGHDGYIRFLDPEGYPAVKPPWGTLNAIDLDKGEIVWRVPLGEIPELAARGLVGTGSENYGGPIVTAGGLVFIGASNFDRKFRAFDKADGRLLWETLLPASGNATPATYEVAGRQFVVIAAGGGKSGALSGGSYVAFALPETIEGDPKRQEEASTKGH